MSKIHLFNEDNMAVMGRYPDKYFDLAIVDPPYGIERFKKGGSHINKHGSEKGLWNNIKPSEEYFLELKRVSKYQIIWGGNNFNLPSSEYFIIWQKSNALDFSFAMCEMAWTNCKVPAKIYKHYHVNTQDKVKVHPTQKPIELYKWLLKHYATPDMKILDTHLGSMSSVIAAYDFGISEFVGCEIDAEYFEKGKARFEQHKRQLNLFAA
jgi:site-specific DNA-methyltransferase (adenine-specific)